MPRMQLRHLIMGAAMCGVGLAAGGAGAQVTVHDTVVPHLPILADLPQLREFSQLAVSPDGRWVAYAMSAPFRMSGESAPQRAMQRTSEVRITLLDLEEHRTTEVTVSGPPRALRWSPSGTVLTFLVESHGRNRLWQYSPVAARAVPRPVMVSDSLGGSIVAFAWSPAGDTIAYLASESKVPDDQTGSRGARPRLVLFRDTPGEYTEPTVPAYAKDTAGAYVAIAERGGGPAHVLARHIVSSEVRPELDWSRSGLLLVSGPPVAVAHWKKITQRVVYTLDPRTGAMSKVLPRSTASAVPAWSPSGRRIAFLKAEFLPDGDGPAFSHALRVVDPARPYTELVLSRESDGLTPAFRPAWGADDSTVYIARYRNGTARLFAVDVATARWRPLTPDTLSVSRYALSYDGRVLVAVLESAMQPAELFRVDPTSGGLTRLTHESSALPAMRLGNVDQVTWRSSDKRFAVHGFLVKPPAYDSTKRYPLVVQLHGGPGAVFTNTFIGVNFTPQFIPPQLLAAAGYLVLLPNPRGDPSYGAAFHAAVREDWGPGPFGDIDAGVSYLVARGLVDSTALGIAGASYGGYLTAYAITQTPRFAAASINDGPIDLASEYGQNFATRSMLARWYFGGPPWTNVEIYARQSPITYVSRVRTPVLMRYGGNSSTYDDIRQSYMLAQGFELYAALKDGDVPVQFVLHPGQGHGILDWALYQDWVLRNLRWFNYWLRHEGRDPLADIQ